MLDPEERQQPHSGRPVPSQDIARIITVRQLLISNVEEPKKSACTSTKTHSFLYSIHMRAGFTIHR